MNEQPKGRQRTGHLYRRDKAGRTHGLDSNPEWNIWLRYTLEGKRVYVNLHTTDVDEAMQRRAENMGAAAGRTKDRVAYLKRLVKLGEQAKVELGISEHVATIPIERAFKDYIASRRRKDHSEGMIEEYLIRWDQFAAWAKNRAKHIGDVNMKMAEEYARHLEAPRKGANGKMVDMRANTVNAHLKCLRMIWNVLMAGQPNPWSGLRSVKASTVTPYRRLAQNEVKALYAKAAGEYRLLLLIGYTTGLRLVDAATLRWEQVNLKQGYITVVPQKTANRKTKDERGTIRPPIIPILKSALKSSGGSSGYVMPQVADDYAKEKLGKILAKLFADAGVDDNPSGKASFHSLRVTWMSLNDDAGTSRVVSRAVLGHTSSSMSDKYSRLDEKVKREAVAKAIPSIEG
jgi:integrase